MDVARVVGREELHLERPRRALVRVEDEDRRARALRGRARGAADAQAAGGARGERDEALLGGRAVGEERRGGDLGAPPRGVDERARLDHALVRRRAARQGGERGDERQDAGGGHARRRDDREFVAARTSSRRGARRATVTRTTDFFFLISGEPNDPSLFRQMCYC